jgi:hypothetical protein
MILIAITLIGLWCCMINLKNIASIFMAQYDSNAIQYAGRIGQTTLGALWLRKELLFLRVFHQVLLGQGGWKELKRGKQMGANSNATNANSGLLSLLSTSQKEQKTSKSHLECYVILL